MGPCVTSTEVLQDTTQTWRTASLHMGRLAENTLRATGPRLHSPGRRQDIPRLTSYKQ